MAHEMARAGLSATQLAAQLGTSEKQVYRVLNASHEPRLSTVQRLATVFGCSIQWLITDHDHDGDPVEAAA